MPTTDQIRDQITSQIIEALQTNDLPPWRQPWRSHPNAGAPANVVSKKNYKGINPLVLQSTAMQNGYKSRWWATYKQWQEIDCHVKKGEKGTQIALYKPIIKQTEHDEESFLLMRSFTVFNAEQCGGTKAFLVSKDTENSVELDFACADHVIEATGALIQHGGNRAVYSRVQDLILLPPKSQFITLADYYETAFHELCHWTEHPSRLNWDRPNGGMPLAN